jgi:hypothetical protein
LAGVFPFELDDGQAVGGLADAPHLGGVEGRRDHDVLVRVFMVGEQHRAAALAAGQGQNVGVVAVVAELEGLGRSALLRGVEHRRVGEQRVAPADDRFPREAVRDGHGVGQGVDRRDGGEGELAAGAAVQGHRLREGVSRACGRSDKQGEGPHRSGSEHVAPGKLSGHDIAEIGVLRGVADR